MTTSGAIGEQSAPPEHVPPPGERGMANPGPWAVTAFATTSFMLGMFQTGLLNAKGTPIVLPATFFFGGLVQFIVAILEFARGNLFAGAVFGTYGPFWVMLGAFDTIYASSVPAAQTGSAVGLFLAVFAVITFYLAVASLRTDLVLTVVMWLIFIGLVLLSVGSWDSIANLTKAGGAVVLLFAVLAWYYAASGITEFTFGRTILPVGPAPIK